MSGRDRCDHHPPPNIVFTAVAERARRHDPDAWEALYRLSHAGLLAYARRRLWGLTEADDAVSETFARAYVRIVDFEWRGGGFMPGCSGSCAT